MAAKLKNKLLHSVGHVKKVDDSQGVVEVVGSTSVVDRAEESIDQAGWKLKNFLKNPVILWAHNASFSESRPPIGKALKTWIEGKGKSAKLMFRIKFDLQDAFAAEIFRKVNDGFINTVSVGFIPLERDEKDFFKFVKQELLELSFVPVPANPEAIVQLSAIQGETKVFSDMAEMYPENKDEILPHRTTAEDAEVDDAEDEDDETEKDEITDDEDNDEDDEDDDEEEKHIAPYADLGVAPETATWDEAKERTKASVEDLKLMSTWVAEDESDFKLLHHQCDHRAVWRGVSEAMALLMGARGGIDITEGERKVAYDHLKQHYEQFGKEAPDFKFVQEQILKTLDDEVHALVLNREDRYIVRLQKKLLKQMKSLGESLKIKEAEQIKKEEAKETAELSHQEKVHAALKALSKSLSIVVKSKREGGEK